MLGEEGTRIEAIKDDAQGFDKNREAAIRGGTGAGKALDAFEKSTGTKVVTADNFKQQIKAAKKQKSLGKDKDDV
jgi:DNA-damage-inducible protein D